MSGDSTDSLSGFLSEWYGDIRRVQLPPEEKYASFPPALMEWYELTLGSNLPLTSQTRALAPARLREDSGYTVFWVEAQGCWEWAFRQDGEGLPVYFRDPGEKNWQSAGLPLADFLLSMAKMEAIQGAPFIAYSSSVTSGDLESVLGFFEQSGIAAPRPYGAEIYHVRDVLAEVERFDSGDFHPRRAEDRYIVTLASCSRHVLAELTDIAPDAQWRLDVSE